MNYISRYQKLYILYIILNYRGIFYNQDIEEEKTFQKLFDYNTITFL